jgi:hypothetical protein
MASYKCSKPHFPLEATTAIGCLKARLTYGLVQVRYTRAPQKGAPARVGPEDRMSHGLVQLLYARTRIHGPMAS